MTNFPRKPGYQVLNNNNKVQIDFQVQYNYTLNKSYIERIHQMSYSSLSNNGMLQMFSFLIKWLYGALKTVPAYSWLFIYFRKYWNLRNVI